MARIEHYNFGEIVVNGRKYSRDIIITPSRIISDWWRIEGHMLFLDDLKDILNEEFEYLVIGTGYYGFMRVSDEVFRKMGKRGVKVIAKPTREAVEEFNTLSSKGAKVVGAFHLTC